MANKEISHVDTKRLQKIYKDIKGIGGSKRTSLPGKEMVWKVQCTKAGARVRAYIWDREERVRIDGCADHYRNLNDFGLLQNYEKELQRTLAELVELSVGEYLEVTADMKKKQKGDEPEGRVMRAFRRIMSEAPELMDHHEWGETTRHETLAYLEHKAGPCLDAFSGEISGVEIRQVQEELYKQAEANPRSVDAETARNGVDSRLYRVGILLRIMYEYIGDENELPLIEFERQKQRRTKHQEQIKSLPDEVRVKLAWLLLKMLDCGFALGMALTLCLGVRPGEAAALFFEDLELDECGGFVSCLIYKKLAKTGRIEDTTKTPSGTRFVIGGIYLYSLILLRKHRLRELGYTEEEIREMPVVCKDGNPRERLENVSELSTFGKNLLLACGVSQEQYKESTNLIFREPDEDYDGEKLGEVAFYILRRDFISRCLNVCGMDPRVVDYLVGHKRKDKTTEDFTNRDVRFRFAKELERHVLLPSYTLNPFFGKGCGDLVQTGYAGYRLDTRCVSGKKRIRLLSTEPGATIVVQTTAKITKNMVRKNASEEDSSIDRNGRMVIHAPKMEEYYTSLLQEAESLVRELPPYKALEYIAPSQKGEDENKDE